MRSPSAFGTLFFIPNPPSLYSFCSVSDTGATAFAASSPSPLVCNFQVLPFSLSLCFSLRPIASIHFFLLLATELFLNSHRSSSPVTLIFLSRSSPCLCLHFFFRSVSIAFFYSLGVCRHQISSIRSLLQPGTSPSDFSAGRTPQVAHLHPAVRPIRLFPVGQLYTNIFDKNPIHPERLALSARRLEGGSQKQETHLEKARERETRLGTAKSWSSVEVIAEPNQATNESKKRHTLHQDEH